MNRHLLEARCGGCGESFNPSSETDLEHIERADGEPCGARGELVREYR